MEFSQALQELIKLIQLNDKYIEQYELMLAKFIVSQEDGDTIRMSFELAKAEINN